MKQEEAVKKIIADKIRSQRKTLWDWHSGYSKKHQPPFYCSVDLRDAGFKIVPVDSNIYPAGFNNICPDDMRHSAPIFRAQVDAIAARRGIESPKRILIIPEAHTTNSYYIENLYYLIQILKDAGFEVELGWYSNNSDETITLVSATKKELTAYPIHILNSKAVVNNFTPEIVLLNNDFSAGYPKFLDEIEQPIIPSHLLGWHTRRKSSHFHHYNAVAKEFASLIGIDPWIIQIDTEEVNNVNFNENIGIDLVAETVEKVIERTRLSYQARNIKRQPFVFIKNNHGTYGMGIMVARSAADIKNMNRRAKNKMSIGKGRTSIQSVIVQEGVPTSTLVDRLAAEPVIYLAGMELIGGFLRTNTERSVEDNLNSAGMVFRKLCMSDLQQSYSGNNDNDSDDLTDKEPVLELVYGSIARISTIATSIELSGLAIS